MSRYVEILNGKVLHVGTAPEDPDWNPEFAPPLVGLRVADDVVVEAGYSYSEGNFVPPPAPPVIPTLRILSATGGTYDALLGEITVPAGTAITVETEVQVEGQVVPAYAGAFRVPVVASDGREKVLGATIVAGVAAITWTPRDSGIWAITQARLNRDLPTEQRLQFSGLRIFVLE